MWGTLGLIWLTLNPLLRTVQWAWAGYERNRDLLEHRATSRCSSTRRLQDLTSANAQLTQLNRLTLALRQAAEEERRAKEQFVANVSHELRTPLEHDRRLLRDDHRGAGSIRCTGTHHPPGLAAALLADLQVVLRNSQHLSSLIDDVLDLSQIEAGQMALTRERVPLGRGRPVRCRPPCVPSMPPRTCPWRPSCRTTCPRITVTGCASAR